MNQIINKSVKKISSILPLLLVSPSSYCSLDSKTVQAINGNKPLLSAQLENNMKDFDLFGLNTDGKNYYGDEVKNMPYSTSYPFKERIKVAPIKLPDNSQFVDDDGDQLSAIDTSSAITMKWYYTNAKHQLIEFEPEDSDTFCSLSEKGWYAPYKIKLEANGILLYTQYGLPNSNQYPNEDIIDSPAKMYTLLEDNGFCYARPSLQPSKAQSGQKKQWNKNYGFLIQSNTELSNFPTTAFYGAQFDLTLAQKGMADQYNWQLIKGKELVSKPIISANNDFVTLRFGTDNAKNTLIAWNYVMGNNTGYEVILEGTNITNGYKIRYGFTITKWYSGWNLATIGTGISSIGKALQIAEACEQLPGNYRIAYADELSNANFNAGKDAIFTREIGSLMSEWGYPTQESYPDSWAPALKENNKRKRIWVYDPTMNKYCDLHPYDGKYHCKKESQDKNGLCIAVDTN